MPCCGLSSAPSPSHRSSRMPLKNGCRTLPSADFARYSISASNDGSTRRRDARSFWHKAGSCGSAVVVAPLDLRWIIYRTHGRPCRRRRGPCPCVGRHRCRQTCFASMQNRRSPASRAGRMFSLPSHCPGRKNSGCREFLRRCLRGRSNKHA